MSVFDDLVGQEHVVSLLRAAAVAGADALAGGPGTGMTHAWLFTGPPGSGRSVAARAFAAALQCVDPEAGPGCGRCSGCRTVLAGSHADVETVRPQGLSIGVKEARSLVLRASLAPMGDRWQVLLVEDADRLTEGAANVLLKAIEEPSPRTVWLLCVPSAVDLVVTIRSRCRVVGLRTPPAEAVAGMLRARDGIDAERAEFAARAAQGHVGRARRLATDPDARQRRDDALRLPRSTASVTACLAAAANLVAAASEEADAITGPLDEAEQASMKEAFGEGVTTTGGAKATRAAAREAAAAVKEMEGRQKSRATRAQRDALDRALTDVASFYRDVLAVQLGSEVDLVNSDLAGEIAEIAAASTPETTLRRVDAVLACRQLLDANANTLLAVEAMTVALR